MSAAVDKALDASVNEITAALGNTSISKAENVPADDSKADDAAKLDASTISAAEGRRLYIGNLAYASTEEELKTFFAGFMVESVTIPRNPRTEKAVGYAFVDLATAAEADRAIAELSGKEILERKVSVQLAHKPDTQQDKDANAEASGGEGPRRRGSGRPRARPRARGPRATRTPRAADDGPASDTADATPAQATTQALGDVTNAAPAETETKGAKPTRAPRERRERGPPADGVPSKTKVMVANLPYDLTEEKLKELFAAYDPVAAKIALRPIPRFMVKKLQARGEARKGRGFGFVTLPSEELQQKAVAEMNAKEIEGREIAVKVAIDSPDKTDEALAAQAAEAAANATEATPTPVVAAA